jgi:hypothetical protein
MMIEIPGWTNFGLTIHLVHINTCIYTLPFIQSDVSFVSLIN